ncbi:hypothetical protein ABMA27_012536 [Loxostege sticticalis]|uniref:Uncharacterized protein n=1 Tax=Loxostege sticticalis TaxID=481309 RepID=A0ABR3GZ89_LOXSC
MFENICRLCLSNHDLGPIFVNSEQSESYTAILALTTGLKIEPNDGFPQKICSRCTELVNSALTLRNQCHAAHLKLVQMIQDEKSLMKDENNSSKSCENGENVYKNDFEHDSIEDCGDNTGLTKFEIEIQCDRLTDDQNGGNSKQDGDKVSRKKVREMYMELVEGVFNPKGPVKCKVCKKTVSSWECFRGHAKLHLQGKKVICEYCGKSFASSAQLKRHCMSFHGMARELACKHCSFLALDKPQLMVHERRMHTGERPYVCDVCAAAYFSRPCLVQHMETHRETATVQCEQCPQKFKSARHLARHRYKAHVRTRRKRSEIK